MARHRIDVEIRPVAMALFVGTDRYFGNVGMHCAVGQDKRHVASSGATGRPRLEFEGAEVRHEVGLPHVAPRAHRDEVAVAREVLLRADALTEDPRVVKDELLVVEEVQRDRRARRRRQTRRLRTARVEVTITRVQR